VKENRMKERTGESRMGGSKRRELGRKHRCERERTGGGSQS
jgi:hypothetical protein